MLQQVVPGKPQRSDQLVPKAGKVKAGRLRKETSGILRMGDRS